MQPDRSNMARCKKCKGAFEVGEIRLQAARASEAVTGKRHTSNYAHASCLDTVLPAPREFVGYEEVSTDGKVQLITALETNTKDMKGTYKAQRMHFITFLSWRDMEVGWELSRANFNRKPIRK